MHCVFLEGKNLTASIDSYPALTIFTENGSIRLWVGLMI